MFEDDPDLLVMTVRVGFRKHSDAHARGFDALSREGFGPCGRIGQLRKRRGEGGWTRWAVARLRGGEERERAWHLFPETENVRR